MVSIVQAWLSWIQDLSSQGCNQHVRCGCSYLKAQLKDNFLQTHLYGCWLILDRHLSEPSVPCHLGLSIGLFSIHNIAACFPQSKDSERGREGKKEITSKMEVSLFVTSIRRDIPSLWPYYFCQKTVLARSKSHLRGGGLHKGENTRRSELVLEYACHISPNEIAREK